MILDLGLRVLAPAIVTAILLLVCVLLLYYLPMRYCVAAFLAVLVSVRIVPLASGILVFGLPELYLGAAEDQLGKQELFRLLEEGQFFGNFTVLELLLLPAAAAIVAGFALRPRPVDGSGPYHRRLLAAWILFLGLIAAGFLHAGSRSQVLRELLKWGEVGFVAIATYCFVDRRSRFVLVYWFLVFLFANLSLGPFAANIATGNALARIFVSADYGIVLLLPFVQALWAQAALIAFFLPMLVLTYSRIAWATVLAAAAAFLLWRSPLRGASSRARWALGLSLTVGTAILLSIGPFSQIVARRLAITTSGQDQSAVTRLGFFVATLDIVRDRPVLGVGAGNIKPYLVATRPDINFWLTFEDLPENPHSLLVTFLAELGVPGLLLGLWMMYLMWRIVVAARNGIAATQDRTLHPYVWGLRLFFIPMLATFLVNLIGMETRLPWGIFFGLVAAATRVVPGVPPRHLTPAVLTVAAR